MNTFGYFLRLTTFGESHGSAIGGVIDGMPPRIPIDLSEIQNALDRRRPAQSPGASPRREPDRIQIISGLNSDNLTLGSPIAFIIENKDSRSGDYSATREMFRPNHADFTYFKKYGLLPEPGGGRSSARETACRVAAGAIAMQILKPQGISIEAWISTVGNVAASNLYDRENALQLYPEFQEVIESARRRGDSVGALISCVAKNVPAGLGDPIYGKLQSRLAAAMMSINAAKSFEYGIGREACHAYGSETADLFSTDSNGNIRPLSNYSGGIQGGISNGADICFSVAFKPIPTLGMPLPTVDYKGNPCVIEPKGRHDSCVGFRAVPVVEAMAALVVADALLEARLPLKAQLPPM